MHPRVETRRGDTETQFLWNVQQTHSQKYCLQIIPDLLNSSVAIIPLKHYFQFDKRLPVSKAEKWIIDYPRLHGSHSKIQCIVEIASSAGCKKRNVQNFSQNRPPPAPLQPDVQGTTRPTQHPKTTTTTKTKTRTTTWDNNQQSSHIKPWHMETALQRQQAINKDTPWGSGSHTFCDRICIWTNTSLPADSFCCSTLRVIWLTRCTLCHRWSTDHLDIASQAVPRLYFPFILSHRHPPLCLIAVLWKKYASRGCTSWVGVFLSPLPKTCPTWPATPPP